jgi:hypothetical protein
MQVGYALDHFEYLPIVAATTDPSPPNTPTTNNRFLFFDVNTPKIGFSGRIRKHTNGFIIRIDRDGDGLYANEEPVPCKKIIDKNVGSNPLWRCGPIRVDQRNGFQSTPFYILVQSNISYIIVYPEKAYCGRVLLSGRLFHIRINDSDLDGHLRTLFSPDPKGSHYPHCDSIAFSYTQDGRSDGSDGPVVPLARMLRIDDTLYSITITEQFKLTLTPTEPDYGYLMLKRIDFADAAFWSDAACGAFSFSGDELKLPVGRYSLKHFNVRSKDINGIPWKASNSRSLIEPTEAGLVSDFDIRPGETTLLDMGTPFQCIIEPEHKNNTIELNFKIIGKAGEPYNPRFITFAPDASMPLDFTKPDPPSFTIVDDQGGIIHHGQFEYG